MHVCIAVSLTTAHEYQVTVQREKPGDVASRDAAEHDAATVSLTKDVVR